MIDAPECGTNLDVLANVGQAMLSADPSGNLIFSAHAYWYTYAANDSLQGLNKINYAISKNIPFVFGEVANLQDATTMCQYTLNYKPWLKIMKQKKIGWLAWSWDNDGCPARQITTNGNYSSLTTFGNDIVNNPIYGLNVGTVKSKYLILGGCGISAGINDPQSDDVMTIYPNPSGSVFSISSSKMVKLLGVFDLLGNNIKIEQKSENSYSLSGVVAGVYIVKIWSDNRTISKRLIVEAQ
jgi:mannan endo-1,4-beta-mannosidase